MWNASFSLDRTNVLQSALAKWVLTFQLKQAGILEEHEKLDSYPDFMFLFRNGESPFSYFGYLRKGC
jgi:hypothetical protein